jgi:hypothetical protein
MEGTTFEFSSIPMANEEDVEEENLFWNEDQNVDDFKSPCETTFDEWRKTMTMISEDVFKKIHRAAPTDAKPVRLNSQRITYHRNMYFENVIHPFDSTHLNGKTDVVCIPAETKKLYLDGFLEALETMKEGEKSLFLIGYKKMFKEAGCPPRVSSRTFFHLQRTQLICSSGCAEGRHPV